MGEKSRIIAVNRKMGVRIFIEMWLISKRPKTIALPRLSYRDHRNLRTDGRRTLEIVGRVDHVTSYISNELLAAWSTAVARNSLHIQMWIEDKVKL